MIASSARSTSRSGASPGHKGVVAATRSSSGKTAALDVVTADRVAETFRALGDPTRVRIVAAIARGERSVGDLAADVGLSHSAVSHQLASLRALRIVGSRRVGRRILYHLDDEHVRVLLRMGIEHALHDEASGP